LHAYVTAFAFKVQWKQHARYLLVLPPSRKGNLDFFAMPPKKRATNESTGAEPASKAKRQDNGEGPSTRREPEQVNESVSNGQNEEARWNLVQPCITS
jgi:hypothetical protein